MADNTILNAGSGGDTIVTDELTLRDGSVVSGQKVQVVKLAQGDPDQMRSISQQYPLFITTSIRQTYRAATAAPFATATTANQVFFIITGSASKVIKVQSILVSGVTLTALAYLTMGCAKYSSAPTGGTATTLTKVPLDSTNSAATANLVQVYTAVPTTGTKVGDISNRRQLGQATTPGTGGGGVPEEIRYDFSDNKEGSTGILRGTAEGIGLYWQVAPASAPTLSLRVEWCEET